MAEPPGLFTEVAAWLASAGSPNTIRAWRFMHRVIGEKGERLSSAAI